MSERESEWKNLNISDQEDQIHLQSTVYGVTKCRPHKWNLWKKSQKVCKAQTVLPNLLAMFVRLATLEPI